MCKHREYDYTLCGHRDTGVVELCDEIVGSDSDADDSDADDDAEEVGKGETQGWREWEKRRRRRWCVELEYVYAGVLGLVCPACMRLIEVAVDCLEAHEEEARAVAAAAAAAVEEEEEEEGDMMMVNGESETEDGNGESETEDGGDQDEDEDEDEEDEEHGDADEDDEGVDELGKEG